MQKKKDAKRERLGFTLTSEQSQKLNNYIINIGRKHGRIPSGIKTKISRRAFNEWFENHGNDLDIDWEEG